MWVGDVLSPVAERLHGEGDGVILREFKQHILEGFISDVTVRLEALCHHARRVHAAYQEQSSHDLCISKSGLLQAATEFQTTTKHMGVFDVEMPPFPCRTTSELIGAAESLDWRNGECDMRALLAAAMAFAEEYQDQEECEP